MKSKIMFGLMALALVAVSGVAIASDLVVGDISLSAEKWGKQVANIKISNPGMEYKFVVGISTAGFIDSKYTSMRSERKSFLIDAGSETTLNLPVTIPAGYGTVRIDLALYDVVDTLDQLFDSQQFKADTITIDFKAPASLTRAGIENIILPKFVEDNALFDSDIMRALLILIHRGKTVDEIAGIFDCSTGFVHDAIGELVAAGLVNASDDKYACNFMVIEQADIKKLRPKIDETIDNLLKQLRPNLKEYDSCLTAMVADGRLSADKNDALDLGTVLYHKYPVMLGLFLWDLLGREFVNNGNPFDIFADSDPCHARMGQFMYIVAGDNNGGGDSYYYFDQRKGNRTLYTGIGKPNIVCNPAYKNMGGAINDVDWALDSKRPDVAFLYNENVVREPLSLLMNGTITYVDQLKESMDQVFSEPEYEQYKKGARYWSWDVVVTGLMKKLEEAKLIEKHDLGLYRFQVME